MQNYNKQFNIPRRIGVALSSGRVVILEGKSWLETSHGVVHLFEVCRTVFGGPVRVKHNKAKLDGPHPHILRYVVIERAAADLIALYERTKDYAGMSVQEFLMRAWEKR